MEAVLQQQALERLRAALLQRGERLLRPALLQLDREKYRGVGGGGRLEELEGLVAGYGPGLLAHDSPRSSCPLLGCRQVVLRHFHGREVPQSGRGIEALRR